MTREIPDIPATRFKESDRWTWRQRRFIQWCALPKEKRPDDLQTQRQIGEFLGVGPTTLSVWKTYPGFWKEVYREAKFCIGDVMPEILHAMAREAINGSVPAAKLCLECLGLYSDEGQAPVRVRDPLIIIMNESLPAPEAKRISRDGNGRLEDESVEGEFELFEVMEPAEAR